MFDIVKTLLRIVKNTALWSIYTARMIKFINSIPLSSPKQDGKRLALIVQPLYIISWPFYMIALGLFLQKKGEMVTYIIDNSNFEKSTFLYHVKMVIINRCMKILSTRGFMVIRLSEAKASENRECMSHEQLIALAHMQAIWFARGEMEIAQREQEYTRNLQKLSYASRRIQYTIENLKPERIIVAGGIVGTSGVYLNCGKKLNISVSTIDGGTGVNLVSNSGAAAQLTDILLAFKSFPEHEKAYAYNVANLKLKDRMDAKDPFAYQTKKIADEDHDSGAILLLLNSVWDQAALGLHTIYPSMNDWIFQTVKWVLENTEEKIIVRQHPAERHKIVSTKDDYKKLLQPFLNHERVDFISADANINTYGLLQKSNVVIAYSTTTALEATMIGKPVITVSNCYYSNLGFVYKPKDLKEYYNYIMQGILGQLTLSESQKNDATLCYYLSQVCNYIFTDFTATMEDFKKWVKMNPESIYNSSDIQNILDSFINGTPIALIRHKNNFIQQQKILESTANGKISFTENNL